MKSEAKKNTKDTFKAALKETSVKTNLTRQRGWAPCGNRLIMDAPFGSWGTQTFIAGLSAGAMIAPWVIKEAMERVFNLNDISTENGKQLRTCGPVRIRLRSRIRKVFRWSS